MERTVIYKYPLTTNGTINDITVELPRGAVVLAFQYQENTPCIWAKVSTGAELVTRHFIIRGTGHDFDGREGDYIGTAQYGPYVWHLYEAVQS